MKTIRFLNERNGSVVCENCDVADNMWTRGKGLLGRASLGENEGIWLAPGSSIHMFFMKFSIDVIFLTKDDVIADIVENIAPGKMYVAKPKAGKPFGALEVAAGTVARTRTQIGDQLVRQDKGNE
jgi:uncharacterized protein